MSVIDSKKVGLKEVIVLDAIGGVLLSSASREDKIYL